MRAVPVFIILLLAAFSPDSGMPVEATFQSGGIPRSYILYMPAGLPEGAPLVMGFHGYTDSARAIPVFMINGTADSTTWWNGDLTDRQHYGVYLPTLETFKFFAEKNKCQAFSVDTLSDTHPADSSYVISTRYMGGTGGNQVWLYTVVNGGHDWVGRSGNKDINAGEEALKFFRQF